MGRKRLERCDSSYAFVSLPLCQVDPGMRVNTHENGEQERRGDCSDHHQRQPEQTAMAETPRRIRVVLMDGSAI
jgi:hypothetical protein